MKTIRKHHEYPHQRSKINQKGPKAQSQRLRSTPHSRKIRRSIHSQLQRFNTSFKTCHTSLSIPNVSNRISLETKTKGTLLPTLNTSCPFYASQSTQPFSTTIPMNSQRLQFDDTSIRVGSGVDLAERWGQNEFHANFYKPHNPYSFRSVLPGTSSTSSLSPFQNQTHSSHNSTRFQSSSGQLTLIQKKALGSPIAFSQTDQNQQNLQSSPRSSQTASVQSSQTITSAPSLNSSSSTGSQVNSPIESQFHQSHSSSKSPQPSKRLKTHIPAGSRSTFRSTTTPRFISRVLLVGGLAFVGYQYYLWRTGNEAYFESMDAMERGDDITMHKHTEMAEAIQEEKKVKEERDNKLRVPKLAVEFSREIIDDVKDKVDSKLRMYEEDLGTITNDYTDQEIKKEEAAIDRQYLKLLMDTMDKIVVPSSRFLNYHTSFAAAHAILRIQQGACKEEIMENYRELMRINHPDVGGSEYIASKITEAKELLYELAHSDVTFISRRDLWKKRMEDRDNLEYNQALTRRLDIIQRRREIMEFRQRMWGTPAMNREPMVVENEASRRVHNLDFGILQMNRGEWPSIPFDGWKPRVFRTADEDSRWQEYKEIRFEIKNAPIRREIEAYHQQQKREWELIEFERKRFKHNKLLEEYRPDVTTTRHEDELERTPYDIRLDTLYNTKANLLSFDRFKRSEFHQQHGVWGETPRQPFRQEYWPHLDPLNPEDEPRELTEVHFDRMPYDNVNENWPALRDQRERFKVTAWEPYQVWKHTRF